MPADSEVGFVFLDRDPGLLAGLVEPCKQEGLVSDDNEQQLFKVLTFNELTKNSQYCSFDNIRCFSQPAVVDFVFTENTGVLAITGAKACENGFIRAS